MNKKRNKLLDRKDVLDYLFVVRQKLMEEFKYELSGIYAYGSLINEDGSGFSTLYSDVDLTITTRQMDLDERIEFSEKLRKSLENIENHLRANLKGETNAEEKERTFFPVISVCLVNAFELDNGIHKNRNSADAFAIRAFHPLTAHNAEIQDIGNRLQSDLVGVNFPAWAILTQVQEMRSVFVSPKFLFDDKKTEDASSNHPFLTLPKELLRYAYLLHCFKTVRNPEMVVEDDLANGLRFITQTLTETASKELKAAQRNGNLDIRETYAKKLLDKIQSNLTGKKLSINKINLQEQLYLWELLSVEAESALQVRRLDSDLNTLILAADPVVLELSRLQATTLMSVDMAISLVYKEDDLLEDGLFPVKIELHQDLNLYDFLDLDSERLTSLAKDWPEDIEKFLLSQSAAGKNCGVSKCKIGFAGYLYTQKTIDNRPKLLIRPLTYWIIQQFNKRMATNPRHPELRRLRERYGRKLFTSPEDFTCRCPSALYVEVAIITKDNFVFKIPKLAETSAFAKQHGGQVFTCGIEWGFSWKEHLVRNGDNTWIDVKKALMQGLDKEFSIKENQVRYWKISTLAIQHAHLNAGLLGVVHLNLTRGDLYNHFVDSKNKYHDNQNFILIPKSAAIQAVQSDRSSGKWHQSALMRLNLLE